MAIRTDEAQLEISFITDESRQLAKSLVNTKALQDEVRKVNIETAKYEKQLKQTNLSEAKRSELLAKVAANEKIVADNMKKIVQEGKSLEKMDLGKVMPQQLIDRAKQLEAALKRIPDQTSPGFQSLQRELSGVNARLREIRQASSGLAPEGSGGGLFGFITRMGPRAAAVLGGAAAAYEGLKRAIAGGADLEQLTISFETFLGSAEKAKKVIADLRNFEAKTPFEAAQVNSAGRALLAFGFSTKELIPTLTRVGDVAAGTGKDFNELALIYGKAKTQGLIQGEELNQLAEAGIPIYEELGKVLDVDASKIRKMGEEGKIQFKDLEQVFKNLTGEGGKFSGLMERQSQSTTGLYSTLKSGLDNLLTSFGTALLPLVNLILKGLIQIVNGVTNLLGPAFHVIQTDLEFLSLLVEKFFGLFSLENAQKALNHFGIIGQGISALIGKYREADEAKRAADEAEIKRLEEIEKTYADRSRAEDARDDLQLDAADRKKLAAELAAKAEEERKAAAERAQAAFEKQLAAADAAVAREELIQQNRFVRNVISETQLQVQLSTIQEDGLRARLDVYRKFGRDEQNAALELKNQLAAIETNRATRAAGPAPVATLGSRAIGPVSSQADNTDQALGVAGIGNDAARVELRQKFEAALITEQDYQLRSLELKRAFIEEELAILRNSTQPNVKELEKREEAKLKVEEQIALKKAENAARLQEYQNRIQQAGFETFQEGINLGIDLLSKDEKAKKKYASVIKTFEIGVVTTQGISEVQKIYAKNAGLPGGSLLSLAESAPAILRTIGAVVKIERQKFAGGGYTGVGFGPADETGHRPVGIVHEKEYVIPRREVENPEVAPTINWLENRRLRKYADGGLVTANTTPYLPPSTVAGIALGGDGAMIREAAMIMLQAANRIPRRIQSEVNYLDIESAGSELGSLRDRSSL